MHLAAAFDHWDILETMFSMAFPLEEMPMAPPGSEGYFTNLFFSRLGPNNLLDTCAYHGEETRCAKMILDRYPLSIQNSARIAARRGFLELLKTFYERSAHVIHGDMPTLLRLAAVGRQDDISKWLLSANLVYWSQWLPRTLQDPLTGEMLDTADFQLPPLLASDLAEITAQAKRLNPTAFRSIKDLTRMLSLRTKTPIAGSSPIGVDSPLISPDSMSLQIATQSDTTELRSGAATPLPLRTDYRIDSTSIGEGSSKLSIRRRLIFGIELGFDSISVAFIADAGNPSSPIDIMKYDSWPGRTGYFLPAVNYYDESKNLIGWGFEGSWPTCYRESYWYDKDWSVKVEPFKLLLSEGPIRSVWKLPLSTSPESAVDMVGDFLIEVTRCINSQLSVYYRDHAMFPKEYWLTTPSFTDPKAIGHLQAATTHAGINGLYPSPQTRLVPLAEAVITSYLESFDGHRKAFEPVFLVINFGNSVVDLVAYKATRQQPIELQKLTDSSFDNCGSELSDTILMTMLT